ncbi:unnamed protein product [Musa textilis]
MPSGRWRRTHTVPDNAAAAAPPSSILYVVLSTSGTLSTHDRGEWFHHSFVLLLRVISARLVFQSAAARSGRGSRSEVAFVSTSPSIVPVFMSDLEAQIPSAFDPFADANADDSGAGTKDYVHIRIQQRNGRKSLTTVQGLEKEFSYNKILKDLKKEFCCNGTVVQDPELGQVIQLQGDQRKNASNFLVQAGIVKKEHIKIHGF